MKKGPLSGRRIVITRPADQNKEWAHFLKQKGAEVILCPAIQTRSIFCHSRLRRHSRESGNPGDAKGVIPECLNRGSMDSRFRGNDVTLDPRFRGGDEPRRNDVPFRRGDGPDLIVFLSANGVEYFVRALGPLKRKFMKIPAFVVGLATKKKALQAGFRVKGVAAEFNSVGVCQALMKLKAKWILVPRVKGAPDPAFSALKKNGTRVAELAVYETVSAPKPSAPIKKRILAGADAVIFSSSSTALYFSRFFKSADWKRILSHTLAVSLGPSTTQTLKKMGAPNILQAPEASLGGLIEALENFFS